MEGYPVLTQQQLAEKLKFAAVVPPVPESDWPTMGKVVEQYPNLCAEEQCWVLDSLINEAHRKRRGGDETGQ